MNREEELANEQISEALDREDCTEWKVNGAGTRSELLTCLCFCFVASICQLIDLGILRCLFARRRARHDAAGQAMSAREEEGKERWRTGGRSESGKGELRAGFNH